MSALKIFEKKANGFAFFWLAFILTAAVLAPVFFYQNAQNMDLSRVLETPSIGHLFGTDALGRDLFARVLCGTSVSLGVSFSAVALALLVGTLFGAVAGYYKGWCERMIMGLTDILLCFPTFFLILAVIAILGPNIFNLMCIIGLTSWMGTARLVRAEVLTLKEREFVLASRALGAGDKWILFKHLVPNALGPVIVNGVLGIAAAVLTETGLSFLGIGVQPPTPSWGNILMDGKAVIGVAWWMTVFPGAMIFLTVLSVNVLGEALHDA